MGQHKNNPTAILAKEGKIPPKTKGMSKSEMLEMAETMLMKRLTYMFLGINTESQNMNETKKEK